jgi:hypothetical protein
MAESFWNRVLSPRVILPIAVVVVALVTITSPLDQDSAARLSTHSVASVGARGLYESARLLGWDVERRESAYEEEMPRNATYAVLAPVLEPTPKEAARLLRAVRGGASLLYVPSSDSPLIDSLRVRMTDSYASSVLPDEGLLARISANDTTCGINVIRYPTGLDLLRMTYRLRDSVAADTVTFILAVTFERRSIVASGFSFGRGRVVLVSAPDMFRNDVLRLCYRKEGVLAFRMLEWLAEPVGRRLIFDEYHQGYGTHTSTSRAIRDAIVASPAGRMLIQSVVACLVLLMAVGARPIPPRPRERIERRSPFEHVGALARAYEKVGATRRATRLLVRGLRRRHDAATWRHGNDEEFLNALRLSHPRLTPQIELVSDAMQNKRSPAHFIEVGKAVEHIERTLSRDYSGAGG